jgi:ABC-type transport system involved in multi-copper enzyme maturation permease subunit
MRQMARAGTLAELFEHDDRDGGTTGGGAHTGTVLTSGTAIHGLQESTIAKRHLQGWVRIALGSCGGRAKNLPGSSRAALGDRPIMAMIAGAVDRIAGPNAAANVPSHTDYYGITASILFVFAAIVGPELLCRDRREGTINLYLVRPLTGSDYVVSRWGAFMTVMLIASWLPQIILFLGLAMGDRVPMEYLQAHWMDIPKFLSAGIVMGAYAATLAMLTASFTTRRAYASVFLVGLFLITTPFTVGLAQEIGGTAGQWISMFSLLNIPLHVNDVIFGKVGELTEDAPARAFGASALVSWYFAWTLVPAGILWWRYRRMTP